VTFEDGSRLNKINGYAFDDSSVNFGSVCQDWTRSRQGQTVTVLEGPEEGTDSEQHKRSDSGSGDSEGEGEARDDDSSGHATGPPASDASIVFW
jgi:hypothetical protein